ncbi:sigma-54-dependent Fis family transcriptional regulator [Mucisphaera calidilacus]|uniref:Formate hydrogenlyase transcriptional activator n=1 Tax=Mucisphaera calidilacus TaxID=2527982 RepID=A0A518BZZ8_9BACT|nr:sigma 54-interacting transcriptional regulator [Mucisphaera calidilacus]QDU72545.1 Formate hydrogenlyase transcriptional activator [Mucisphaera calidilacus]
MPTRRAPENSPELKALLLDVAAERSLEGLLSLIVRRVAAMEHVALCRVWLIDRGDVCATCRLREECPDQSRCLHLVASAGRSEVDRSDVWDRLDGRFMRFPLGVRKIGHVAATGDAVVVWDTSQEMKWVADPAWAERESIRGLAAQPLVFRGEVIGVFAVFMRSVVEVDELIWYRMLADHVAAAIVNARAFAEIDRLKRRLEIENAYLREEVASEGAFGEMVGSSAALRNTTRQIEVVADTGASVLITGESGTGKELVAREIHRRSGRRDGPMIKVNCAAIPRDLYESEFFGHVEGAFSGAVRDRAGRFEAADGGTLFLDEVGEIPIELQSKLLRVLQEGTFERVGEARTRESDVRVVAATNRDLRAEVDAGRFREDLYYRLNVFPIEVAPLRQRREDIPELAHCFLEATCQRLNRPMLRLTKATVEELLRYGWPGNVRELQNVIERGVITSTGRSLVVALPAADERATEAAEESEPERVLTAAEMRERERENIVRALEVSGGRVSGAGGAAALLGMRPSTLSSRMKALRLRRVIR